MASSAFFSAAAAAAADESVEEAAEALAAATPALVAAPADPEDGAVLVEVLDDAGADTDAEPALDGFERGEAAAPLDAYKKRPDGRSISA